MEKLQLALSIWSGIGILACIVMICFVIWRKDSNPDFLTDKASLQEALKAKKIILGFLSGFVLYTIVFMCVVAYMAYDSIPKGLCLPGVILLAGGILMMLLVLRKK